jgi:hypothetical protein
MNKDIAYKWADALESGKYVQATGRLRVGDTYCCLGVLCDISELGTWKQYSNGHAYRVSSATYASSQLPYALAKWAGIQTGTDPELAPHYPRYGGATYLNDNRKLTFKEIAALIRKNWETI